MRSEPSARSPPISSVRSGTRARSASVDHGAAQRARPVMLDLELRLGHFDRALVELAGDLALLGGEILHLAVLERAHRDDR